MEPVLVGFEMVKKEHERMLAYKNAYESICRSHNILPDSPSEVFKAWETQKAKVREANAG